MSQPAASSRTIPLARFLDVLRANGFPTGIDLTLHLSELLLNLPSDIPRARLKTLLCPLFAGSKEQQDRFYVLFEAYFPLLRDVAPAPPIPTPEPHDEERSKALHFTALLILGLVATLLLAFGICAWRHRNIPRRRTSPAALPNTRTAPKPQPEPRGNAAGTVLKTRTSRDEAIVRQIQFSPQSSSPGRFVVIFLPLALLWIFLESLGYFRRRAARAGAPRKPPSTWQLKLDRVKFAAFDGPRFMEAARQLRQREMGGGERLNMVATVAASVRLLGFPVLRYTRTTRRPEYVLLIDRRSARDHQAAHFIELAEALRREGLLFEVYYFSGDPSICTSAKDGRPYALESIYSRTFHHRLLLFGEGEILIDGTVGDYQHWTQHLAKWARLALLTPKPRDQWGAVESAVGARIPIIPATVEGIGSLVELWERRRSGCVEAQAVQSPPAYVPGAEEAYADALRVFLGPGPFEWVCASALYPRLEWNLTLHLGHKLGGDLLNEATLLRLAALPWFRRGAMPETLQQTFVRRLAPEVKARMRTAILEVLRASRAEPGTYAEDAYGLEIVTQRMGLDPAERAAIRDDNDPNLVRLASTAASKPVPARWRQRIYRHGIPILGFSLFTRTGIASAVLLTAAAGCWLATTNAGQDLALVINSELPEPGQQQLASNVGDPTAAVNGHVVLYAGNWYAATSADGGQTFRYIDPFTAFPDPPDLAFCCFQVVTYIASIDTFVWLLQYNRKSDPLADNIQRLAFAKTADVAAGRWRLFDITPKSLGVAGQFLDYGDLAVGSNFLYVTTNIFTGAGQSAGAAVVRIPIASIEKGPVIAQHFISPDLSGLRVAQNCGTTAFFASHKDTSTLELFSWEESQNAPTSKPIEVARWIGGNGYESRGPDGRTWLGRIDPRITGATLANNELWLAWSVNRGPQRPQPFVQIARIDSRRLQLTENLNISDELSATAYPSLTSNANGDVGISYMIGGGPRFPSHVVGVLTGTPKSLLITAGERGPLPGPSGTGEWGDYLTVRPVFPDRKLFAATGYTLKGSGDGSNRDATPRFVVFGRTRDLPLADWFREITRMRRDRNAPGGFGNLANRANTKGPPIQDEASNGDTQPTVKKPGVERWPVKTGADPDAQYVIGPVKATIEELVNLPRPSVLPLTEAAPAYQNRRARPVETTIYTVEATLLAVKLEADGDYHLVLQGASGNEMVAEVPNPDPQFVAPSSRWAAEIARARSDIQKISPRFGRLTPIYVRVTGVGFFDRLNGQMGAAQNGIELHPVIGITFKQ